MNWFFIVFTILAICFAGVLLVGAPYLPTLNPQVTAALDLAALKPGDTLLELGCGDGKVLIAAAERGIKSVGYELNPIMASIAWLRTRRYSSLVTIIWGDFWHKQWPSADAIFTFLLPRYMKKLNKKVIQYNNKPVKIISNAFVVPGKRPAQIKKGVYLYLYD